MKKIICILCILSFFIAFNSFACQTDGVYPDLSIACTPGSVYENVTLEQICTKGYSKTVRHTTQSMKNKVYEMYDIPVDRRKNFVLDHLVSLQLGGRDDVDNLFPQRTSPKPNSRDKDRIENFLKRSVCKGDLTLKEAQDLIRNDWLDVWEDYMENLE